MNVIVGLGNPGMRYARTRHNIGFKIVDALVERADGAGQTKKTKAFTLIQTGFQGNPVAVIKPMMYMNLSGEALSRAPFNFKGQHDTLLVVHDDVALPFGSLRFRARGSAGGHKGLRNIIDVLGTQEIPRLKIGVGQNRDMPLEDYVLMPFSRGEARQLPDLIDQAADALALYLETDLQTAMNRINTKANSSSED